MAFLWNVLLLVISPITFCLAILAAIFAPAIALIEFCWQITSITLAIPSGLFLRFETLYIFCGSAAILGVLVGVLFGASNLAVNHTLGLDVPITKTRYFLKSPPKPNPPPQLVRRSSLKNTSRSFLNLTRPSKLSFLNPFSYFRKAPRPSKKKVYLVVEQDEDTWEDRHIKQVRVKNSRINHKAIQRRRDSRDVIENRAPTIPLPRYQRRREMIPIKEQDDSDRDWEYTLSLANQLRQARVL